MAHLPPGPLASKPGDGESGGSRRGRARTQESALSYSFPSSWASFLGHYPKGTKTRMGLGAALSFSQEPSLAILFPGLGALKASRECYPACGKPKMGSSS